MPDAPTLPEIQVLRDRRRSLDMQLYRTRLELEKLRAELARRAALEGAPRAPVHDATGAIASPPPREGVREVREEIEAKEAEHARLVEALDGGRRDLHTAIGDFYVDPHPRDLVATLDDGIPFLLLPVRIETRFVTTANARELWLRVYPDDIAIHTHEQTLTDAEVEDGEAYWSALFDAIKGTPADVDAGKRAAWTELTTTYPPQRAAWVALQTKPTNWSDDLVGIADADDLAFPVHDLTKTNAWSRAPRTDVMPDRFVVLLYEGGENVAEIPGKVIPDELFVGPDPFDAKNAFQTKDTKLGFGADYDWTSDFDKSVEVGLGFKIPLVGGQATNGFERIVVLGVFLSGDEAESQRMVERLIDNHHYSPKGFSIVPQGAPTNNTDQSGSGYTRNDPFGKTSYLTELGKSLFGPADDCDGRRLADALGIGYGPLQHVMHADARDHREAIAMNRALYPGTLGFHFGTMLQPLLDADAQAAVREFFVRHVTGRGPLPAIRVGDQPYGVLLTSDFSRWEEEGGRLLRHSTFAPTLLKVLRAYGAMWKELLDSLAFVGKSNTDPSAVLMDVLGLQAGSVAFHQRNAYSTDDLIDQANFQAGGRYVEDLRRSYRSKDVLLGFLQELGARITDNDGRLRIPQLLRLVHHHRTTALDAANLIDGVPLSEERGIRYYDETAKKNYVHWLAEASSAAVLEREDFGAGIAAPNALLYLMLRKALLEQLHDASARFMEERGVSVAETSLARNFLNIRPTPSLTKWEVMKAPVAIAEPASPLAHLSVAEYLLGGHTDPTQGEFLSEVRAALAALADLPTARLERCFTEHLDACTYRLDAWQTGLFDQRLQAQRGTAVAGESAQRRQGIQLGAYGWVEQVRPSSTRQVVRDAVHPKLQPKDGAPLFEYKDSGGFVHAPSLNHAAAAAVLRSGYMTHASAENPDAMAVNLSSERVRRAMALLEGMRQEQTLEALLGYQFERGLHDRASANNALNLNLYIYAFRDRFPYQQHRVKQRGSDEADADYAPQESIAASNVVNGVRLAEATESDLDAFLNGIAGMSSDERAAIVAERDRLADSLDAVKDLLLSESVYQLVQGNFDRTSATLNALQEARIPADLEIVNTPRSSTFGFTNRVTLHFAPLDPAVASSNPWAPIDLTPRARMEPGLNHWLALLIGEPSKLLCTVGTRQPDGTLANVATIRGDQLGVQPIDLVYMAGTELNTGEAKEGAEPRTGASEIESRVAFVYRTDAGVADDVPIGIEFLKPEGVAGTCTFGEILPLLRMLRAIVVESRPLHAEDFNPPSKKSLSDPANPKGYDLTELAGRVTSARTEISSLVAAMDVVPVQAQIEQSDGSIVVVSTLRDAVVELDRASAQFADGAVLFGNVAALQLRQLLRDAADHGGAYAFPSVVFPTTDATKLTLLEQARSVIHRLDAAVEASGTMIAGIAPTASTETQVSVHIAAARQLFGEAFAVIPRFMYNNEADVQLSHADEAQLLAYASTELGMSFPADEWLHGAAHVRPKLARWDYVRTLHELMNGAALAMQPVQLPYRTKDSWIAVQFPELYETLDANGNVVKVPFALAKDTVSVTVHGAQAFVAGATQCGLLIDDWSEMIPTRDETTGITFNYDQPNAMPPQALLLAVTPTVTGRWSWDELVGVVEDTLLRAKLRAVEPRLLDTRDRPELGVMLPALMASFSEYDLDVVLDYRMNLAAVTESAPIRTAASRLTT